MKNTENGSYDKDDGYFMTEFLDLMKNIPKEPTPINILPDCPEWRLNKIENIKILNYELMILYNTAGYIINCIIKNNFKSCDNCIQQLGSYVPVKTKYARFQNLKHFKGMGNQKSQKLFYYLLCK